MRSKKFTFKKEYEPVDNVDESVWMGNDTPIMESDFTFVFNDRYPCVPGHKLFIPKRTTHISWVGPTAWHTTTETKKSRQAR